VFFRRFLPAAATLAALLFSPPGALAPTAALETTAAPPAAQPEWTGIPVQPASGTPAPAVSNPSEIKIPNFTSCSIADLEHAVPELTHLKPESDQSQLAALLDKIGAKVVDIANKTPDLISHEEVVTVNGGVRSRQDFSFLVLEHETSSQARVFDEYRVDVKTGQKFQTGRVEEAPTDDSSGSTSLAALAAARESITHSGKGPSSQGFVNNWLNFHPTNREQSDFRYLGEEKMDGHGTVVVAFAQKPGRVALPLKVYFDHKIFQVFMQGVAWVDPVDFRILRLWMDILAPPVGVPLRQLSSDVHFAETAIADLPSPLWLPREVVIITNVGSVVRETHRYSNYRLFRTRSKLVLK
jgi:hypothetical protein